MSVAAFERGGVVEVAGVPSADMSVPGIVRELAGEGEPDLVWRNDLGGLTFRIGDQHLKWNPRSTGVDLERERVRLEWLVGRHPAHSWSTMAMMATHNGC